MIRMTVRSRPCLMSYQLLLNGRGYEFTLAHCGDRDVTVDESSPDGNLIRWKFNQVKLRGFLLGLHLCCAVQWGEMSPDCCCDQVGLLHNQVMPHLMKINQVKCNQVTSIRWTDLHQVNPPRRSISPDGHFPSGEISPWVISPDWLAPTGGKLSTPSGDDPNPTDHLIQFVTKSTPIMGIL